MKRRKIIVLSAAFVCIASNAILFSCSKTNEKALENKGGITCDSTGMTFQKDIVPILSNNCYSCHGSQTYKSSGSNLNFQDFTTLNDEVKNGELLEAIEHTGNVTPMPLGLPQLSECEIGQIKNWINNGAQNN